jgi:hypothetical protein
MPDFVSSTLHQANSLRTGNADIERFIRFKQSHFIASRRKSQVFWPLIPRPAESSFATPVNFL